MKYNKIDRVILFCGAPLLVSAAQWLKGANIERYIYTSPHHTTEVLDDQGLTLGEALLKLGAIYTVTEDINSEGSLREIIPASLGLGIGEAWSFSKDIIDLFNGQLLDFMGSPHPRYRGGGAHYTWMILRGERQGSCNLQVIDADMVQGVFNSGEIVKSKSYNFPERARTLQDYFLAAQQEEVAFIAEFLQGVKEGKEFEFKKPDESKSLHLPRLLTLSNGWINWAWNGLELERFICAFDTPYAGASTRLNGKLVHLKAAQLINDEAEFHPFQSGIITRINIDGSIVIATTAGHLLVKQVLDDSSKCTNQLLHNGIRFFSPAEDLKNAALFQADYGTGGLKLEKKGKSIVPALIGQKISLRPVVLEDCTEEYVKWLEDSAVNKYLETRWQKQTLCEVQKFVQAILDNTDSYLFAIIENATKRHIGNIKIGPVHLKHSYADISYFIGEQSAWSKGYATEAIELITQFGFAELGLHRCQAGAYASNIGSTKALKKAGYSFEGRFKGQLKTESGWDDHLWYGLTKEDWLIKNKNDRVNTKAFSVETSTK